MSAIALNARTVVNPIIQDKATFLETFAETNGKRTFIQVELAPKGGNDLHYHKSFDETFTAVDGTLGVQIGKKISYLKKGESATVPAGQMHRFFNPSAEDSILFNVLIEPGNAGFETSLQVAYGLASDGLTNSKMIPKNIYHLALVITWADTNIPGIIGWIEPLLHWLAKRAIRKGIDQELKRRYCKF